MDDKVNTEHLLMLIALLFVIYFIINIKETFELLNETPPTKDCSKRAINDAYNNYVFGGVKFIR